MIAAGPAVAVDPGVDVDQLVVGQGGQADRVEGKGLAAVTSYVYIAS